MTSAEYKRIIAGIITKSLKKYYPGLKRIKVENAQLPLEKFIAINIHARMYGANVDGVDSPIWRDYHGEHNRPDVDASELLKQEEVGK